MAAQQHLSDFIAKPLKRGPWRAQHDQCQHLAYSGVGTASSASSNTSAPYSAVQSITDPSKPTLQTRKTSLARMRKKKNKNQLSKEIVNSPRQQSNQRSQHQLRKKLDVTEHAKITQNRNRPVKTHRNTSTRIALSRGVAGHNKGPLATRLTPRPGVREPQTDLKLQTCRPKGKTPQPANRHDHPEGER